MLVLTRKWGETVHINDDIVITVIHIDKGQIRLGIDAPTSHAIYRGEIYRRMQEERDAQPQSPAS